jgi:hypothetical protein
MPEPQKPAWSVEGQADSGAMGAISRVKVIYEGETVDADEMEFKAVSEPPISYQLNDRTIIEIKHEVKKVYRLCDKRKPDGSPIYLLNGAAHVRTETPKASEEGHKN